MNIMSVCIRIERGRDMFIYIERYIHMQHIWLNPCDGLPYAKGNHGILKNLLFVQLIQISLNSIVVFEIWPQSLQGGWDLVPKYPQSFESRLHSLANLWGVDPLVSWECSQDLDAVTVEVFLGGWTQRLQSLSRSDTLSYLEYSKDMGPKSFSILAHLSHSVLKIWLPHSL